MNFGDCEFITQRRKIVLEENRRKIMIRNPREERIRRILVDGCAISVGKRCDYLLIGPDNSEYFIELKGCHIQHAISQLETTIKQLGAKTKHINRCSIIISSRCPLITPKIQQLTLYFKRKLMSSLIIKCNYLEVNI